MGLRERKKVKTRQAISDIATQLFLERGYHSVTTAEIAQRADVSVTTLFNYFPTKESLVFDEDQAMEEALIQAVVSRSPGTPILEAVRAFILASPVFRSEHEKPYAEFAHLIRSTPELSGYARQMWLRHEAALARAIEQSANEKPANEKPANEKPANEKPAEGKLSRVQAEGLAHYVLEAVSIAQRFPGQAAAFNTLIDLLRDGADI